MHVYISADMEGISGIATYDQVRPGGLGYARGQELMTGDVNAAIEGAFRGGATTVTVNDSHNTMDNLLHATLDPRARLIFGSPKLDCMAEGMTEEHDVALFVGYHAAGGTHGVLAHTFCSDLTEVRVNGEPVSETDINAMMAASVGVPVGLVTGDDLTCVAAEKTLPGVRVAEVKKALGICAANCASPHEAQRRIKKEAEAAVAGAHQLTPVELPDVIEAEVDMPTALSAECGRFTPGVRLIGSRTLAATFTHPRELGGFLILCFGFVQTAVQLRQGHAQPR